MTKSITRVLLVLTLASSSAMAKTNCAIAIGKVSKVWPHAKFTRLGQTLSFKPSKESSLDEDQYSILEQIKEICKYDGYFPKW